MKKRIALIVISTLFFVFALVDYIQSFYSYNEDGYAGYSFDTDSLIILITSIVLIALSAYHLYKYHKKQSNKKEILFASIAVTGFHACYSLFTLLRIVGKAVQKMYDGAAFELSYQKIEAYIPWFLIAVAFCIYFVFELLEERKKHSK